MTVLWFLAVGYFASNFTGSAKSLNRSGVVNFIVLSTLRDNRRARVDWARTNAALRQPTQCSCSHPSSDFVPSCLADMRARLRDASVGERVGREAHTRQETVGPALGMCPPASAAPAGGLGRVLGTVGEVPRLAVLHAREALPLCSPIALQCIRHDHGGTSCQGVRSLRETFCAACFFRRLCARMSSTLPS